uniref:Uncharacterized protein n=1 Tax=Spironucleus salmonicida TaxID=348837 RepID=V6LN18_9EUKA|eukprot:EST42114.1 hypothetical protein SS50377_18423 [Spironucleus salmonicida]
MQPQKPLIEQTARTTPLQPLSNNITIQRTNYNLWTASQQQKNVDLTIRKSLRKAQKSQNYSPTRPSNNVLMQRLINLWDALQCPQQERDYAYSEILKEPALANDYARTMRQILFHRRRFQELETERTQLAENVRTTLQAGRGSKRALLADLIKLRVMTLELFSLMNSARRFSARPIDLPTLEVLEFSQIKRIFSEGILSRENLSVAFCVMRFIDGNYDEVSAQVNDVFDQLIVQGTNDEEIQVAFLLGSPILESQIPSQFQKFLVRKFDEIFEVKLEKYEPKDYVKPSQVLEMIKGETKGYNQYIRLIQQLQAKEMEICTVPIHHSEKSYDAYSVSVEYLKDIPAEEVKQVRKNFTKQLQSKFNEKSQSQIDDRILQLSQNSKMQQQQVYRPVLKVRNDNVIKKQEYEQKRESEILIKEEIQADVPMTLEAPPHDEFDEFPADVPTTLELKPQEEDDFEDTPQHVPATLEEPMHDDEFDDAPAVDSRQFVQNMPSPFEYNNDDIIAYAVDTGNSNSVANLITEAPADEYDFEETPADVPMTLEAPPHDEFDEFPADVPTTLELKPQEEDDFEDTPQHVPATLEETMQEIYTSPFTFIINETEFI